MTLQISFTLCFCTIIFTNSCKPLAMVCCLESSSRHSPRLIARLCVCICFAGCNSTKRPYFNYFIECKLRTWLSNNTINILSFSIVCFITSVLFYVCFSSYLYLYSSNLMFHLCFIMLFFLFGCLL